MDENHLFLNSISSSRILLSPLNWGLGHVSRTIPVIRELLQNKNEVILFGNENQLQFYRFFFPEILMVSHADYPFQFGGKGNWTFDIAKNFNKLKQFIHAENQQVDKWVGFYKPDLIISDQRYGFVSPQVKSVIISHQLSLPTSKLNFLAHLLNYKYLNRFNEIWIPDTPQQTFSGKLSDGAYKNKRFIGICSRFDTALDEIAPFEYKYLGIISGPFPYNRQFLNLLSQKMQEIDEKCALIVAKELVQDFPKNQKNIDVFTSPSPTDFIELLQKSETIVSRSGYSTILDLAILKKPAILIPTPGQGEQIYLAELHKNNPNWKFYKETEFTLKV